MGKLFINATKNFGNKIETAISNSNGRIDGIHYSLADIPKEKTSKLRSEGIYIFPELPLYYLTTKNDYIEKFLDRSPIDLGDEKSFIPNERNNKLICLENHIDLSFLRTLPLTTFEYSTKREEFLSMVNTFYNSYYQDDYLMTPTFMINKVGSWEEIMLLDVLKSTNEYLVSNPKSNVFLSILLDPTLLDSSDIAGNILSYIDMYPLINNFSLTIISDESMYYHTKDDYKNILTFIKELRARGIEVYLQYCGIKDIVFSVLNIKRFSVGWFGSYRNFDTNSKRISEVSSNSFGKRIRKILTENFMSEIPLSYLSVLNERECIEYFSIEKNKLETIDYKDLEQRYWCEMLKIIEEDASSEKLYTGDELINYRCEIIKEKLQNAIVNLSFLIRKLKEAGRFTDASKLEKNNLKHVELYEEVLNDFQEKLFF
ncbi:hypothetical protein K9D10_000750 [Enterococcus faecalis]|nr:hypothetical protein [Enterococcus faecalis]